jgi:tRNA threonylcarbamoyladenosine biosynthesis protein TsaE
VTIEHVAHGADALRAFGARLAQALLAAPGHPSLLVTLSGELGAGKTTLVGGLLAELGHSGPVRSPTYTLIEPYRLQGRDIAHCDLYRLRHPDELEDLGLRDLQGAGSVLLVEWPEKAEGRLGAADLALTLDYAGPDARSLVLEARSLAGQAVLARL